MSKESFILVENTSSTGITIAQKGAGYHKQDNLHTAVYNVSNFEGTIKLAGTLELYPNESDWVYIKPADYESNGSSDIVFRNFTGNFVWLRAEYAVNNGTINEIRYKF